MTENASARDAAGGLAVGVDLGGTKIAAGVFAADGAIRGEIAQRPTLASGPPEGTIAQLHEAIDAALASAGATPDAIRGIGVGTSGPLDPRAGILLEAVNLPRLFHFPLRATLEARHDRPVVMSNDANCFALAEALFGEGRGEEIVLGVTLGTGCGIGLVIQGRIVEGATANAGEVYRARLGDLTYDEALSGGGLERLYRKRAGTSHNGPHIARIAAENDPQALATFADFGRALARGLGVLAALVDPGVIVLGGSVSRSFDLFSKVLRRKIGKYLAPSAAARLRIEASRQIELAGPRGAAALIFSGGRLA